MNAKAICITDDTVLGDLKRKKVEKAVAEKKMRKRDLGENVIRKSEKRNNWRENVRNDWQRNRKRVNVMEGKLGQERTVLRSEQLMMSL